MVHACNQPSGGWDRRITAKHCVSAVETCWECILCLSFFGTLISTFIFYSPLYQVLSHCCGQIFGKKQLAEWFSFSSQFTIERKTWWQKWRWMVGLYPQAGSREVNAGVSSLHQPMECCCSEEGRGFSILLNKHQNSSYHNFLVSVICKPVKIFHLYFIFFCLGYCSFVFITISHMRLFFYNSTAFTCQWNDSVVKFWWFCFICLCSWPSHIYLITFLKLLNSLY